MKRWPLLVVMVVLVVLDHLLLATGAGAAGLALHQLDRLDPERARRVDRAIARGAAVLGEVVGTIGLGIVWGLVIVPVTAVGRLLRIDPLRSRGRWSTDRQPDATGAEDLFTAEPRGRARGLAAVATAFPLVVGWLVILAAANYAVGWAYDEVVGSQDVPPGAALDRDDDPTLLAHRPALDDAPWALDHLVAVSDLDYRYEPYLQQELVDGTYGDIRIEDHHRRSWEPEGAASAPEVWVFGGSSVFGSAQRDDHTIPSELARELADAGHPARVVNLANPGYTSYQEWLLFERLLHRDQPALAVFLDGNSDLDAQLEYPTPDPTHFNRRLPTEAVGDRRRALHDLGDVFPRYEEDSLLRDLVREVQGIFGMQPAAAAGSTIAENALDLGLRARAIIEHLGEREDVPVLFVREPAPSGGPTRAAYDEVTAGLPDDTLDLSLLLDADDELFVDQTHVNEEGARRIAVALAPAVLDRLTAGGP